MRRLLVLASVVAVVAAAMLLRTDRRDDELPGPVAAFERGLEASGGVLHVVVGETRVVPEPGLQDLPPSGVSDEIWFDLGGSGWRAHRTSRDGGFQQVADGRGIRTLSRDGSSVLRSAADLPAGFRLRPWPSGAVVDPVWLVRRRPLRVVGRDTVRGRPAYVVAAGPSATVRLYVAQDGGGLLRATRRVPRAGHVRTLVQDYVRYEVDARRLHSVAEFLRGL